MSCDPYFTDVSLLLTFEGVNGQTAITDSSSVGNTVTVEGGAALTNTAPLVPPTSGNFVDYYGSGWYSSITSGGPLDLHTGSYTVEAWIKTTQGSQGILWSDLDYTLSVPYKRAYISGGVFSLQDSTVGALEGLPVDDGNWHHIVASADVISGKIGCAVDGVWNSDTGYVADGPTTEPTFYVGFDSLSGIQNTGFLGQMYDLRVTKNIVRYPIGTNFVSPVPPLPTIQCVGIVPNVIGLLDAAAQSALTVDGFVVGTITEAASLEPPGTVVGQSPIGGTVVTPGSTVNLTESAGVIVPNLENLSEAIANEVLISAGFVLGLVTYVPDVLVIPGNVVTQLPVAGSYAAAGSPVNVALSSGRVAVPVPDLIGLTQVQAIVALENLGLVPGAIGSVASTTVPAGTVISQNIGPGIPYPIWIAVGSLVGFVVSSGPPPTDTLFNYEPTVISQYANSPTLLQLIDNMNQYMDQSTNFANFLSYIWNVDSAVGFGLDIWGKIVNVSRLLNIPNSTKYVGFYIAGESQPDQDWTPAGSNQPPQPAVGGAMYTGHNATTAYLLDDNSYRQLILAKAFANICSTTAPAINQILQNLYGAGQAYVLSTGVMAISYNFNFTPTPIQLAILTQSGVIPTPPGVSVTIVTP
jgi:beta-lactam-binding protein with PASTA domain